MIRKNIKKLRKSDHSDYYNFLLFTISYNLLLSKLKFNQFHGSGEL